MCMVSLSFDSKSWFSCQTRIALSLSPLKLGMRSPVQGIKCGTQTYVVVVYALLLPGTARRACYLCNMCDLPQEIHPVMTTDYVYVWSIEMHP